MLYTNADQFIRKSDDLCMVSAGNEPDVMLINEIIPKAQLRPISLALLTIPEYNMYLNFDPSACNPGNSSLRGICIYVKTNLHVAEVTFSMLPIKDQLWIDMPLCGQGSLLLGCIYHSPSGVTDQDVADIGDY